MFPEVVSIRIGIHLLQISAATQFLLDNTARPEYGPWIGQNFHFYHGHVTGGPYGHPNQKKAGHVPTKVGSLRERGKNSRQGPFCNSCPGLLSK